MDYRQRIYDRYSKVFKNSTDTFDKTAAENWGKAYNTYLQEWLPSNKQAHIADLACGQGNLLYFFKNKGFTNISGVDISPEQINLAKQVTPNVSQDSVFSFLSKSSGQFELLTALDLIEHFTKDEVLEFLDLALQALKPGGRLVLQTPNAASPWSNIIRYGDFTHETCFEEKILGQLLQLCGFTSVKAKELGPVAFGYSFNSTVRYVLWRGIRLGIRLIHTIESGSPGGQVLTRVFMISAVKPM